MTTAMVERFGARIQWTHRSLLAVTDDLGGAQIARQPGPAAPPIGWHLFHMARWADRLQASFQLEITDPDRPSDLQSEIWSDERLAAQWGLEPAHLGLLETGAGMAIAPAVAVAALGKDVLLAYARRTFDAADQAVAGLQDEQLRATRRSILPQLQVSPAGRPFLAAERTVTVSEDLLFHISHGGRHLGMIEALRGALFAMPGTASV